MLADWTALLPPILAITIAMWQRNIIMALLLSLWVAETLLSHLNPGLGLISLFERIVAVFSDPGQTRVLLFSLLVGALLALFRTSGGVSAFIHQLTHIGFAKTKRRALLLPSITGTLIFIETNLSILTSGIISQTLLQSIGLNFYAIIAVIMVYFTAITGKVFGPMRDGNSKVETLSELQQDETPSSKSRYFLIPLIVLVAGMPLFMLFTGQGHILKGSGSQSVLWSVSIALLVCGLLIYKGKQMTMGEIMQNSFKGMSDLLPLVTIVLLSMALGAACIDLGTGAYVAHFVGDFLPPFALAGIIFICAGIISFTTGTSWGTFAIMMPLGIPLAMSLGVSPPLILAAILGGGVFGDHCSPISDSTLMASLASGCDHLEHVRTQLPYALAMAAVSTILYFAIGLYLY
jgi:Na+/H+ antiporter NhaC